MPSFSDLGVPTRLNSLLTNLGIDSPTPIQAATLPDSLAGRDILGRGRTGSGKTLAFLLPLVTRLSTGSRARSGAPRALVLAPTRELASQIDAVLRPLAAATGLTSQTVFGGVGQNPQVAALQRGVDIVVACPGRLEDLIQQGHCSLAKVQITVLDEADHMADLGFLPAVRRLIAQTPAGGQRMLFSATLDRATDALVQRFLADPAVHQADSAESPVTTMTHHLLQVAREQRLAILVDLTSASGRTVVFTRTKHGAKALARQLSNAGVHAVELHGNLSQNARTRALDDFHSGRASALVATDIAARGIHVDDVALVIHADPPADHKAYLHRSGRTVRAGNAGTVVTLMTSDQVRDVKELTRAAHITPVATTVASVGHPVLAEIAPGTRSTVVTAGARREATASTSTRDTVSSRRTAQSSSRAGERRRPRRSSDSDRNRSERVSTAATTGHSGSAAPARRSAERRPAPRTAHSAAAFSAGRR